MKSHVESLRVNVRFVQVQKRDENDKRGTAFARVGTFQQHKNDMNPLKWSTDILVRECVYYPARPWASVPQSQRL